MSLDKRWYPAKIDAGEFRGAFDETTVKFLISEAAQLPSAKMDQIQIAEFGIWKGGTSYQFAKFLAGRGMLHLFDYEDNVNLSGNEISYQFTLDMLLADIKAPNNIYENTDHEITKIGGSKVDDKGTTDDQGNTIGFAQTDENKPTIEFEKIGDDLSGVNRYEIRLTKTHDGLSMAS